MSFSKGFGQIPFDPQVSTVSMSTKFPKALSYFSGSLILQAENIKIIVGSSMINFSLLSGAENVNQNLGK
jgi:hypothetical protein